jgi:hypothetical protein
VAERAGRVAAGSRSTGLWRDGVVVEIAMHLSSFTVDGFELQVAVAVSLVGVLHN